MSDLGARLRQVVADIVDDGQEGVEHYLTLRGVREDLTAMAEEWERLAGVREKVVPVLQAVREWTTANGSPEAFKAKEAVLAAQMALEAEVAKVAAPPAPDWRPGTWGEVISGDRVRLGTAEAVVEFVVPMTLAPSGIQQISVKLQGREKAYAMAPHGQVEILRGAPGQAVDESGATVLASWGPDFVDAVGILREAFPGLEAVNDG